MDKILFKNQTGKSARAAVISSSDVMVRNLLSVLYEQSVIEGRKIEMIDFARDGSDNNLVVTLTFGLGEDVSREAIIANAAFPNFFSSGRHYNFILIKNTTDNACQISGGITPGGFELFTSRAIGANAYVAIPVNYICEAAATFFIHNGGDGDSWNDASLNVKTESEAS
jgi:hypothetical protein